MGCAARVDLPLPGRFQADNALMAAALASAAGIADCAGSPAVAVRRARPHGVGGDPAEPGAAVYVDYAHTPDALERLLAALRPHTAGRLHVVFGAGGDRDRGKRPLMGAAVHRLADAAIVTDDNPRAEDPAAIRAAVLAAAPGAREIGDRAAAIAAALNDLRPGDVLAVAGKGHEQGQTIGAVTLPFDDVAVGAPAGGVGMMWSADDLGAATMGAARTSFAASGVSIDTRTLQPGDLFVALVGEHGDGHAHVAEALAKGAAGAMVQHDLPGATLLVHDTLQALWELGRYARARFAGRMVAVTGSVGKTTTKEMLRTVLCRPPARRTRPPPPTTTSGACR